MDTTFLCHLHWKSYDNQIWSSQHVHPSYDKRDLSCLISLEFYLKPLKATALEDSNLIIIESKDFLLASKKALK